MPLLRDEKAAALALGRWCLGLVLLFFGTGKFENLGGFVAGLRQQFEPTWLPGAVVALFGYVLPFAEVLLGLLLIAGLFRRSVLFATGALFLSLVFGQVILRQPQTVFANSGYLFMTAALLFFSEYDRWSVIPENWMRRNASAEI